MSDQQSSGDRLREILHSQRVPSEVLDTFAASPDLAVGQIWRARWNHASATVLLAELTGGLVRLASASVGDLAGEASPHAVRLGTSTDSIEIAVWLDEQITVHKRVLDRNFFPATPELVDAASLVMLSRPGGPPTGPIPRRQAARLDALAVLADTDWLEASSKESLLDVLRAENAQPSDLIAAGIPTSTAVEIFKGKASLPAASIDSVADRLSIDRDRLESGRLQFPADLVGEIDSLRSRPVIDGVAAALQLDEVQARRELAREAYALAARQTGSKVTDWTSRVAHAGATLTQADR